MSKKIKLNLEDLKVESFVTSLNNNEKNNIKGMGGDATASCVWVDEEGQKGCGGGGNGGGTGWTGYAGCDYATQWQSCFC